MAAVLFKSIFSRSRSSSSSSLLKTHDDDSDIEPPVAPPVPCYHLYFEDQFWAPALEGSILEGKWPFSEKRRKSESDVESQSTTKSSFKVDARVISDAVIGLSDGLTVPFALTAGLSALGDTKVVIYGGMAELIAGAISMGLGGYLGAKSEGESYNETLIRTRQQIATSPAEVTATLSDIFTEYDLPAGTAADLTAHLATSPKLLDFLMRFQHTLPEPAGSRALTCAATIALGYFAGGFVPLLPYFFVDEQAVQTGLWWSVAIMVVALFVFGWVKTSLVVGWRGSRAVGKAVKGGAQMVLIGSLAAGAAMGLVVLFDRSARGNA